jgi:5-methyltetrahydropteroyltriglutamate--homocysteine methyltransferase
VEHPDTIADRIVRFAELVGRENVVASADCGFSSQATYRPEIHPQIVWAKFESLAEGAELAVRWDRRLGAIKRLAEAAHAENKRNP